MDIVLRAAFLFAFVFVLMRAIGKRELSSLEPFDLVLLIVLGDAIQQGLTQDDYSVTGAVIAVSTIGAIQVTSSYLAFRSKRVRKSCAVASPVWHAKRGRMPPVACIAGDGRHARSSARRS